MRPRRRRQVAVAPPRGLVLEVQRHCQDEGPGPRTVVLLKGCPLRCLWCHDPQKHAVPADQALYNRAMCNNCMNCLTPDGSFGIRDDSDGEHAADGEDGQSCCHHCTRCGSQVETCAQSRMDIVGRRLEVAQLLETLEQDRETFEQAGDGGLTITGGEPMAQFGFTLALLQAAHERGFHTCLVTSGVAPPDQFLQVMPYVDLFHFDYKSTDEYEHIELTAISNDQILDNLHRLHDAGANIVVRCPLAPGINDTPGHLQGIARLSRELPRLRGIDLRWQPSKLRRIAERAGTDVPQPPTQPADAGRREAWVRQLRELGCDVRSVEEA